MFIQQSLLENQSVLISWRVATNKYMYGKHIPEHYKLSSTSLLITLTLPAFVAGATSQKDKQTQTGSQLRAWCVRPMKPSIPVNLALFEGTAICSGLYRVQLINPVMQCNNKCTTDVHSTARVPIMHYEGRAR